MIALKLIFPLDYVVLLISVLFILFSAWKGFIQSILALMTWVGSIIITLYTYSAFSNFLNKQLLNINIFQNYEIISELLSVIIAIPIIFLISLFILKRIRKVLSSDLDKQIFGILVDKILGIIYGVIFSYFIFTTVLFALERFDLSSLNMWFVNNSNILFSLNNINQEYIYSYIPNTFSSEQIENFD